mmetsp:Transcript_3087/g.4163  ORF Transcript_3087/g.4163 Transcript_3087/m.4163 type:complete len:242 (-) Transcript_3087:334-1059(-)
MEQSFNRSMNRSLQQINLSLFASQSSFGSSDDDFLDEAWLETSHPEAGKQSFCSFDLPLEEEDEVPCKLAPSDRTSSVFASSTEIGEDDDSSVVRPMFHASSSNRSLCSSRKSLFSSIGSLDWAGEAHFNDSIDVEKKHRQQSSKRSVCSSTGSLDWVSQGDLNDSLDIGYASTLKEQDQQHERRIYSLNKLMVSDQSLHLQDLEQSLPPPPPSPIQDKGTTPIFRNLKRCKGRTHRVDTE